MVAEGLAAKAVEGAPASPKLALERQAREVHAATTRVAALNRLLKPAQESEAL
jgi:hypothetical protein